jgi:hypothetical protein
VRFTIVTAAMIACLWLGYAVAARAAGRSPLVITRGGTYSGTWSSDDGSVPVVVIKTAEPVVIENSTLRGRGHLIVSTARHADITIRNVRGFGMGVAGVNAAGQSPGRFASIERFDRVVIENCLLEATAGIYLLDYLGDRTPPRTVRIVRNRAKNIDGRKSDGNGGLLPDEHELVQFVQLDKVRHVPGIEIAWNEVINEPGNSAVEDNISIYLSSGTRESPIHIHDNFIRGAYPLDAARASEYSGGGIMLGDGVGQTPADDPSFVLASDNQVLDTVNYGIAISAGHDNSIVRNRVISTGLLPDGQHIAAQNTGAYIWDSYKAGKQHFFNNSGQQNLIGWIKADGDRNDWWTPDAAVWAHNLNWPEPIAADVYAQEWRRWQAKLASQRVTVGPVESSATKPTSP